MRMERYLWFVRTVTASVLIVPILTFAQQSDTPAKSTTTTKTQEFPPTRSGYTHGDTLEGAGGVTDDLAQDDVDVGAVFTFPTIQNFFVPWFDWKKE